MTWLQRNDKLLTALVLGIGIAFAIYVFFYQRTHLTANLTKVDCVAETEYGTWYFIFREK